MLGMRGEKDKQLQIQISEEEDAFQCGDEQSQIPGQKLLASKVRLLPTQEGQQCTALFKLQ